MYSPSARMGQTLAGKLFDNDDALNSLLEKTLEDILKEDYSISSSVNGWLFVALIDAKYIDGSLKKKYTASGKNETLTRPVDENGDIVKISEVLIERFGNYKDVKEKYENLERLTEMNAPALTGDSFIKSSDAELYDDIKDIFTEGCLNVVVIGAGFCGLALASALKMVFGIQANILVIENRVYERHYKKPYSRRWITNMPLSRMNGIAENGIIDILSEVGNKGYIGVTINIYESLMLLSCRRMGVQYLFSGDYDLSFIENSNVHVVFDASGNRFSPTEFPEDMDSVFTGRKFEPASLNMSNEGISAFGIKISNPPVIKEITIGSSGDIVFPMCDNERIITAMVKLIHIPIRFYDQLIRYIVGHNSDNKFYAWPGTLKAEINQVILIINLKKEEYLFLSEKIQGPTRVDDALRDRTFAEKMDARVIDIFEIVSKISDSADGISIEPPFLFDPYLIKKKGGFDRLFGRPVIPVGDSIYNGNVKLGNGISPHLSHIKYIQESFRKNFY